MPITFSPPLADARDFPAPGLSMLPTRPGAAHGSARTAPRGAGAVVPMSLARHALAFIGTAVLGAGCRVWLPAYHCPALVEPFIWAGCDIDFYPLNADLTPDLSALYDHRDRPAACVLVRYFGLDCAVERSAGQLRAAGYTVIEDLAHAAHAPALFGDYGVTSLWKFYPVQDGAELLIASHLPDFDRLRAAARAWLLPPLRWQALHLKQRLGQKFGSRRPGNFRYLQEHRLRAPMSRRTAGELIRHDHGALAARRRANFRALSAALAGAEIGTPLFGELGESEVPYIFPLLLHDNDGFGQLRNAGIPLYRWEELAASGCAVSRRYRSRLVQLPCHQALTAANMAFLINSCGGKART